MPPKPKTAVAKEAPLDDKAKLDLISNELMIIKRELELKREQLDRSKTQIETQKLQIKELEAAVISKEDDKNDLGNG